MASNKIYVGLDIGTSKTCMVVGEVKPNASLTILGVSRVPTFGIKNGIVSNPDKVLQCVTDAWEKAQQQTDIDIVSVFISISGGHIASTTNKGVFKQPDGDSHITQEIMQEVINRAQEYPIDPDRFLLHKINGLFSIDKQAQHISPIGLEGHTVELKCHIISGNSASINSLHQCVARVPLAINDIVFGPLATAQYVLSRADKQLEAGTLLLDIGAGTTDYVLYKNSELVCSGCIPMGGDQIMMDISAVCGVRTEYAEKIKISEGDANHIPVKNDEKARLLDPDNEVIAEVSRNDLNNAIQERLRSIFDQLKEQLPRDTFLRARPHCPSIILCGGVSLTRGIGNFTSNHFRAEVKLQTLGEDDPQPKYLEDPRYFTAMGLLRYAQILEAVPTAGNAITRFFRSIFSRK